MLHSVISFAPKLTVNKQNLLLPPNSSPERMRKFSFSGTSTFHLPTIYMYPLKKLQKGGGNGNIGSLVGRFWKLFFPQLKFWAEHPGMITDHKGCQRNKEKAGKVLEDPLEESKLT